MYLVVFDRNPRTRNDRFDYSLAVLALAVASSLECLDCILKFEAKNMAQNSFKEF